MAVESYKDFRPVSVQVLYSSVAFLDLYDHSLPIPRKALDVKKKAIIKWQLLLTRTGSKGVKTHPKVCSFGY